MSRIWPQLLPELAEHIASFLHFDDIAFGLRLVNKAAAAQFRGPRHTTIRLSQPVPHHVFVRKWTAPGATRSMTYLRRRQLLCLTAASGSIPNLEAALLAAACRLTGEVMAAAAAAGKLDVCQWLVGEGRARHDALDAADALEQAALHGHFDVCAWLLGRGHLWSWEAVAHAARGGHTGLVEWLLQQKPQPTRRRWVAPWGARNMSDASGALSVLEAAAEGCGLSFLQHLCQRLTPMTGPVPPPLKCQMLAGAAASATPDWAAKVEWLEGQGCPRIAAVTMAAAAHPHGATERLGWLQQRGYPTNSRVVLSAAKSGDSRVLDRLQVEGIPLNEAFVFEGKTFTVARMAAVRAANAGHLNFLQALWHHGVDAAETARAAAKEGHLHVVAWLVDEAQAAGEAGGARRVLRPELFRGAAESGSVELMAWLRQRGCGWDAGVFTAAAKGGCEEALEWLAERGCPMEDDGSPYIAACGNSDLATLRCLRRLGCPGSQALRVLSRAAEVRWVPVLRCLLEEGGPAGVGAEAGAAQARGDVEVADLLGAWQR